MTRVMRLARSLGKEALAMMSLKDLCGFGVIKQIDKVGVEFRGCGRRIFAGLSRFCGTICFFVVVMSHTGSLNELSSASRRFLDVE